MASQLPLVLLLLELGGVHARPLRQPQRARVQLVRTQREAQVVVVEREVAQRAPDVEL